MRKTWAEYKRGQRQKERNRKRAEPDAARLQYREPFFRYFQQNGEFSPSWYAAVLGDAWWRFDDDSGIEPEKDALTEEDLANASDSLGKAELLAGHFADLAREFAIALNNYKRREIDDRIKEIEDLDRGSRQAVLDELERLKKMRHQLNKDQRERIPKWKVTAE